jgi:cell division cycle 14
VNHVVRLNKPCYEAERFTRHGIDLTDMFFVDGSTPPLDLVEDFLEIVKNEPGGLAVHCKAGLG